MTKHVLISIALLLGMLGGCSRQVVSPVEPLSPALSPAARADRAWQAMQYDTARTLYRTLLQNPGLEPSRRALYRSREISAGIALNDLSGAGQALADWAANVPAARDTAAWQRLHLELASRTRTPEIFLETVQEVLARPDLPWPAKKSLLRERIDAFRQDGAPVRAMRAAGALYAAAPDQGERRVLEHETLALAGSMPPQERSEILAAVSRDETKRFPFSLVAWTQGRDLLERSADNWGTAYPLLSPAAQSRDLVDPEMYRRELAGLEEQLGSTAPAIALLVPMSGPYRTIGRDIARGAQCALPGQTGPAELRIINSAGPDWQHELAELGPQFKIVGGPLRPEIWKSIKQRQLHRQRLFLSFMSSLPGEGQDGWRFFGSPADQIRTVVRAAMDIHGVRRFAVLYPKERFGSTMAREFWKGVRSEGGELSGMGSYAPNSPKQLGASVATLLNVSSSENGEEAPEPDFQAVFLPDSLSRVQLLAPQFFYYDAKNLLFLGPQVWNQAFLGHADAELQYLSGSIFPGAWWPDNPDPEMARLQHRFTSHGWGTPGFWAGLGYDFITFGSRLGGTSVLDSPEHIASRLHSAGAAMPGWTIAPLNWDNQGQAHQAMFLFRPGQQGPERIRQPESVSPAPATAPRPIRSPAPKSDSRLIETNIPS
ncbi:MAG TPA: penicillin-binding protein activator [Desulfomicrobiaceae bacterium]|nr:penicillin-binding protein activator [Desulfomicrobiaceae bacterium]